MNVLGLVQLCQATPVAGGYSHSFGLDALAERGLLTTAEQLLTLLRGVLLAAIGPADGVASGITFRAARQGDFDALPEVCHALSSDRLPLDMRLASLQMGQALWERSRAWPWAEPVHTQLDALVARHDLHHAVAFGVLVSETTNSQVRAIATYLLNTARAMVAAAVRSIPLDEQTGQEILATVQPTITELAQRCVDKHPVDIIAVGIPGGGTPEAFRGLFHS